MAAVHLEYTKTILQKVSFDPRLFRRELQKALGRLMPRDLKELENWVRLYVMDKPELQQSLVYLKV
mgnify:CR=1 FL=1